MAGRSIAVAYDGRRPTETLDYEPMRVIETLMARGTLNRSLRLVRPIDANAGGILQTLLSGACPFLDRLELEIDLGQHSQYLVGMLEALTTTSPTLRELVLLFDPVPIPAHLLATLLASPIDRITVGSRAEGVWHLEASTVGELFQSIGSGRASDRMLVLVHPMQGRCHEPGRLQSLEIWPDQVRRTIKMTAMLTGTRLFFARDDPIGRAYESE